MSNIHPYEMYKMYMKAKIHFSSLNFYYEVDNLPNINYSFFINSKNYNLFLKSSARWSKEYFEKLLVSNFLIEPKLSIYELCKVTSRDNMLEWEQRLKNLDKIFMKDLKKVMMSYNCVDFIDLSRKYVEIPIKENKKMKSMEDLIAFKDKQQDIHDFIVLKCNPEFITILNELYVKKYNNNVLYKMIKNNVSDKKNYIKNYKYKSFIDFDTIFKKQQYQELLQLI